MSNIYTNFIGIDIGKFELVLNIYGSKQTYTYSNDIEGLQKLYSELKSKLLNALIVMEVTGGYERLAITYLQQYNIAVHRANGRQVKSFIRSYGIIGKSDNIDAMALALYAKERHPKLELYKPSKQDILRKLNGRRCDLVKIRVQEKNRLQAPDSMGLYNSFKAILEVLDQEIAEIEKKIADIIASDPELQLKIKTLETITGVGKITAHAILAHMPEIGTMNQKQVASLAGVAPHPNQSGVMSGYCRTRGGRRQMRPTLFIAALSVTRSKSSVLGQFYHKLVNNGKAKRCALVAVMRKMVVIGNARIKEALAGESSANCVK